MSTKKNINGIKRKTTRKSSPVTKDEIVIHRITTEHESELSHEPVIQEKKVQKKRPARRRRGVSKGYRKLILIGILILLIFFIISLFDRTVVTISSHTESRDIDHQVSVKKNPKQDELGFDLIAIHSEHEFTISGAGVREVQEKASGTIRIFNDYSTAPQRLVEETRFESVDGKIYKLPKGDGVIIPGKKGDTPGSVDVKVYADVPGELYNIGLTDFTIPGFKELGLDTKYKSIYALSVEEFTGGGTRTEPIVTQSQEEQAIKIAQDTLALSLQDQLEREKTDDFVVVSGTERIDLKELEYVSSKKNEHSYVQKGTIYAVIVRKDELKDFLVSEFLDLEAGQSVSVESFGNYALNYSGSEIDYENAQNLLISLNAQPIYVWNTDEDLLKKTIVGIDGDHTSIIFAEFISIEEAAVDIRPFWRKKVSDDESKIKIKYE